MFELIVDEQYAQDWDKDTYRSPSRANIPALLKPKLFPITIEPVKLIQRESN